MGTSLPLPEPTIIPSAEEAWGLPHAQYHSKAGKSAPLGPLPGKQRLEALPQNKKQDNASPAQSQRWSLFIPCP